MRLKLEHISLILSIIFCLSLTVGCLSSTLRYVIDEIGYKIVNIRQEVLEDQISNLLNQVTNKTIAILTNPTSVDSKMKPLFQRILQKKDILNITIKCFFAPEHGLRGDQQDGKGDSDYIDSQTGIQVYSLYGVRKAPTVSQLSGVDILLYDIQDVGCRFYTFIWTLTYTIQTIAQTKVQLFVFDRPNPLGRKVEGCPLNFDAGLVGRLLPGQKFTISTRYGLTIGQFIMYVRAYLPTIKITIITMKKLYQIKQSQWVLSSPNMPTLQTVLVYPGMGLVQGTSISQGRGTTKPFEITGTPSVKANLIIEYFAKNNISQNYFNLRQNYFIPTFSKSQGQVCGGVQIHIIDRQNYDSIETALHLLRAYLINGKNISVSSGVDILFGRRGFFSYIQDFNTPVNQILKSCEDDLNLYKQNYKKYWLYNDSGDRKINIQTILDINTDDIEQQKQENLYKEQ